MLSTASVTRREIYAYLFIVAFIAFLLILAIIVAQMLNVQSEIIDLGAVSDFRTDIPNPRAVNTRAGESLRVWVVHVNENWIAYDGLTTFNWGIEPCYYQWQPVSGRFEDPCSGAKYALTGELLNPYSYSLPGLRDLDRYPIAVRDNHLYVNVSQKIRGTPRTAPPPNATCTIYSDYSDGFDRCFIPTPAK